MSAHNICFCGIIGKIIPKLPPNTLITCSAKKVRTEISKILSDPIRVLSTQELPHDPEKP